VLCLQVTGDSSTACFADRCRWLVCCKSVTASARVRARTHGLPCVHVPHGRRGPTILRQFSQAVLHSAPLAHSLNQPMAWAAPSAHACSFCHSPPIRNPNVWPIAISPHLSHYTDTGGLGLNVAAVRHALRRLKGRGQQARGNPIDSRAVHHHAHASWRNAGAGMSMVVLLNWTILSKCGCFSHTA
jgi:hypothetical protein